MSIQNLYKPFIFVILMFFHIAVQADHTDINKIEGISQENCQNDLWLSNTDKNNISVSIRIAPPFIDENSAGDITGLSWTLWRRIAKELKQKYPEFNYHVVCLSLTDSVKAISKGKLDVIISPLTVTYEREKAFDFSHQYMNSKLVIAYKRPDSQFDFEAAFTTLSSALNMNRLVILLAIFLCLSGGLFILTLKYIDDYQVANLSHRSKISAIFHVMINSMLNTAGIRQDVYAFTSAGMQVFSVLILIFGIIISASFFSMLTASLTKSVNTTHQYGIADLSSRKITTLQGSTAEQFINKNLTIPEEQLNERKSWLDALDLIKKQEADLLVGDWVQLLYLSKQEEFGDDIIVQDKTLQFEPYGFGLRNGFAYRDIVNQQMIKILRSPSWTTAIKDSFGNQVL